MKVVQRTAETLRYTVRLFHKDALFGDPASFEDILASLGRGAGRAGLAGEHDLVPPLGRA